MGDLSIQQQPEGSLTARGGRRLVEQLGVLGGWLLSPLTGLVAGLRRARMFHPSGLCFQAQVAVDVGADPSLEPLARRLAGNALVRLSSAWWKHDREWPDVLGIALRFCEGPVSARPGPGDQDLLFATVRTPWQTPLGPLFTDVHDYLSNRYHAVSPFQVPGDPALAPLDLYFRLSPEAPGGQGDSRRERLLRRVAERRAMLRLEVDRGRGWELLGRISLIRPVELDQAALRFSPFRTGRGIEPRGFVQALRRGAYAASQALRPAAETPPRLTHAGSPA